MPVTMLAHGMIWMCLCDNVGSWDDLDLPVTLLVHEMMG